MWIVYFITCPNEATNASKDGILLWFYQILPILLPYAILSNIVVKSNLIHVFSGKRNILPPGVTFSELFILICGFFFGFPLGSKLCADFLKKDEISLHNAQILCVATNQMSPGFVSVYVLTNSLHQKDRMVFSFLILYGIPFVYAWIRMILYNKKHRGENHKKPESRFNINMEIVDTGIVQSFETLIRLCGYIVIFSLTSRMFLQTAVLPEAWKQCAVGFLEVTNGIAALANSSFAPKEKYVLAMGILSFGGLCGLAQTSSVIRDTKLSIKNYFVTKVIFCILVLLITALSYS